MEERDMATLITNDGADGSYPISSGNVSVFTLGTPGGALTNDTDSPSDVYVDMQGRTTFAAAPSTDGVIHLPIGATLPLHRQVRTFSVLSAAGGSATLIYTLRG
jgi:hypothetical protein